MTEPVFDTVIHAPHRLQICAMLSEVDEVEFSILRDGLGVADSVLSKQLKVLTDNEYVGLSKPTGQGGRVRTWARLTPQGKRAFRGHLAALHEMVANAQMIGSENSAPSSQ